MQKTELLVYTVIIVITFLFIVTVMVWLLIRYFSTKVKFLRDKSDREQAFQMEISKTKSEIQHETLNLIGEELHDNIGQLLTVAKIYSNLYIETQDASKILELDKVLEEAISETRGLAHSLNIGANDSFNILEAIKKQVQRINKTGQMNILFVQRIDNIDFSDERGIIIYRIIQEFISNSLKYANASQLEVILKKESDKLQVSLSDNGIGFNILKESKGAGLTNITNRINLLNGNMDLRSTKNIGTQLKFSIPNYTSNDL